LNVPRVFPQKWSAAILILAFTVQDRTAICPSAGPA
jgi:hypothetical protein